MASETTPPAQPDPLVMPADEFAALRTVARELGMLPPSPAPAGPSASATEPSAPVSEAAVVLCPGCLHDGVLERTLARAEAAEAKLADALAVQDRLRGHLDAIAAKLPVILEALSLADGVHEGDGQYKAARKTLDEVWPF